MHDYSFLSSSFLFVFGNSCVTCHTRPNIILGDDGMR